MGVGPWARAVTYYSQGSGAPQDLALWNAQRAGGGQTPGSFTQPGDQFVIQSGHVLVTTASWTVGATGSLLSLETGAVLHATFPVLLTGTFQIANQAVYYHDNRGSVSSSAGASIFGGTELFAPASLVEIRNWINATTPLPSVNWGRLVLNYQQDLGGNWNQQGNLTQIQGDFIVKRTGIAGQDFRLTVNTALNLVIGGNLEIENGALLVKEGNATGTTALVQVMGSVWVTQGVLDLGAVDFKPNNELRFKGNLFILGTGLVKSQTEEAFLVANGNGAQTYYSETVLECSFKVNPGTLVKLNSAFECSSLRDLVVAGSFLGGDYPLAFNGGDLIVSGGSFRSNASINMRNGICQTCQGNGSFSFTTAWCASTGDTGTVYLSNDSLIFNRTSTSLLRVGALNSKGKVFLSNSVISFSGPGSANGGIELTGNSTLSFDETSYAAGSGYYQGMGGWLVIGSPQGIQLTASTGAIRFPNPSPVTNNVRNYNFVGTNHFEYNGSQQQFSGNGLPVLITGTLRINNSNVAGVTLSGNLPYRIASSGTLQMVKGNLRTTSTTVLVLTQGATLSGGSAQSYVEGPLRKLGNTLFTYPVGKQGRYSPLVITGGGAGASDSLTVEYFPGNPLSVYDGPLYQFIDHLSSTEYWNVDGPSGGREITFPIVPYSGVTDFPTLVMGYWDGSGWINLGAGTKTGTPTSGTMKVNVNNYGPFTFASTSALTNHLSSLPVRFLGFEARRNGGQGLLQWQVSGSLDADYFEVLTSTNNRDFIPVARVMPRMDGQSYQAIIALPVLQDLYCRIRAVDKSGAVVYSRTALIKAQRPDGEIIALYPTVTKGSTLLQLRVQKAQTVQVVVYDALGLRRQQRTVSVQSGDHSFALDLSALSAGVYIIDVRSNEGLKYSTRVIRE